MIELIQVFQREDDEDGRAGDLALIVIEDGVQRIHDLGNHKLAGVLELLIGFYAWAEDEVGGGLTMPGDSEVAKRTVGGSQDGGRGWHLDANVRGVFDGADR